MWLINFFDYLHIEIDKNGFYKARFSFIKTLLSGMDANSDTPGIPGQGDGSRTPE